MIHKTDGIVLRSVKYGDTSGVVTIYTRLFGMQAYLINGIRSSGKNSRSHLYQPGSILDMQVYHNSLKKLQRVKEAGWKRVYKNLFTHVIKNSIALFMVELLQKSIPEEEENETMYLFIEESLLFLDEAKARDTANLPLRFMLKLSALLGFGIDNNFSEHNPFFNPREGKFTANQTDLNVELSETLNPLLSQAITSVQRNTPFPLLNGATRRTLLHLTERYYQFHIPGFTELKSLKILEMVMNQS